MSNVKFNKMKNTAVINRGSNGINIHLNKIVCKNNAKRLYKSFGGVHSWVGGIWYTHWSDKPEPEQGLWVQIPYPAHRTFANKNEQCKIQ